nr:LOW QUALITY PROTEIN: zygote arrest protein 1 [Odocoileus virginianus texanus]
MAALGDIVLDGYLYPACALYSYRCLYPAAAAKGKSGADEGGSRPRGGGYPPVSSSSDGAASSSFPGQRQLAAAEYVHSYHRAQLMALLSQVGPRRASTRDAAVQMNPCRDVSVQCSLGRRTLGRRARESGPSPDPEGAVVGATASREQPPPVARVPDAAGERSSSRSPQPGKERLRFQFLEQKYGYYHCKDCNIRWESAYVWCVQGTNKVYYKQFCRTCQKSYNPYRVEDITCQNCKQTRCSCPVKLRHVDPKRPHRQDLCGRCKGKRLSCDSTFSFKYII